jgi:hypothetical protein
MHRAVVVLGAISMLVVCSAAVGAQNNPPESRWVAISKPYLAKRGSVIVLAHTISSTTSRECPVTNPADQKYLTRVRIFRDAQLNDREIHYVPELAVSESMVAAAEDVGSAEASVPPGTFESSATTYPAVFKPTWYRRVDKGFGMRAYENSGDLTVTADELRFVDGDKTVRIPFAKIQSVRWEPLPNDIANHWIVVKFINDEGNPDGVAFRDGARLGTRGRSGPIYQAVRNPKK